MKRTLEAALVDQMAAEQRRVVSDWRALMLLRRATRQLSPQERRWARGPESLDEVRAVLRRQVESGGFKLVEGTPQVYETTDPYARGGVILEDEILMEVRPHAALAYVTALAFHGLTDEFPREMHAIEHGAQGPSGLLEEDEDALEFVYAQRVEKILNQPLKLHRLSRGMPLLGMAEYRPRGYPVRVTTPERTLLDALMHPEWCGGIGKVLEAWLHARDTLNLEELVSLVDQFDVAVLRQRVGFLLEELKLEHPRVARWPEQARRGGSSKLAGSEPFAPTYSERWKLSINVPIGVLREALA